LEVAITAAARRRWPSSKTISPKRSDHCTKSSPARDLSLELGWREGVQVELAGEVAREYLGPDEVVVEVADRSAPGPSG
jgi:hypothetical protein